MCTTPWKKNNMKPPKKHGGLVQVIFLPKWATFSGTLGPWGDTNHDVYRSGQGELGPTIFRNTSLEHLSGSEGDGFRPFNFQKKSKWTSSSKQKENVYKGRTTWFVNQLECTYGPFILTSIWPFSTKSPGGSGYLVMGRPHDTMDSHDSWSSWVVIRVMGRASRFHLLQASLQWSFNRSYFGCFQLLLWLKKPKRCHVLFATPTAWWSFFVFRVGTWNKMNSQMEHLHCHTSIFGALLCCLLGM